MERTPTNTSFIRRCRLRQAFSQNLRAFNGRRFPLIRLRINANSCGLRVIAVALILVVGTFQCLAAAAIKPKLVVGIMVDQFRYDYLTRFRADYHGGLDQLLSQGADFTNAFYAQVPTVTAVGHSIFMSG